MAVRQYIGARYVPRFVGDYDVTQSYEALDVVDNGSGTSYIAKIPTPAGTPLTDTDHWFLYGSTSGAIVNLQQQINDMKDGTVPGSLQEQIDTNTSDITALANNDCIIIAASYGMTPSASDNCVEYLKIMLANKYRNIYSAVNSGAGFVNGSYLTLLQGVTVAEPVNIKDIIVIGQGNDVGQSESDIVTAMTTFRVYANSTYPNARISLAPVSSRKAVADKEGLLVNFDCIMRNVDVHLIGVMDNLFHILALNYETMMLPDGRHPTIAGSKLIARGIYNNLLNGTFKEFYTKADNNTSDKSFNANILNNVDFMVDYVYVDNNIMKVQIGINFNATAAHTIGTSWGDTIIMSANPLNEATLYPLTTEPGEFIQVNGILCDKTAGTFAPITLAVKDLSGGYFYAISTRHGLSYTLTVGHSYAIRCEGTIPFMYN